MTYGSGMLTEAQGKYLFTFTLQVFESKPHCVCTEICLRDGVGFTQPTHCICLLLEFIQRRLPILSDLQRARVCVIAAHQEQTIVFGCLLYLVYYALVVCILVSVQRVPEPDPIPGISFATQPDPIQF